MDICNYPESERSRLKKRLWVFFSKYDPEKLSSNSGNEIIRKTLMLPILEKNCFDKICAKYAVDTKDEEENAKKMNLFPNSNHEQNSALHEEINTDILKSFSPSKNSILRYSATEKQRLVKRLEKFFIDASCEQFVKKIETLLLGDVSEPELMKRLCALHGMNPKMEEESANASSLANMTHGASKNDEKVFEIRNNNQHDDDEEATISIDFGSPVNLYPPSAKQRLLQRLLDFYQKFDPSPSTLDPSTGKAHRALQMQATENQIFATLCQKFQVGIFDEQDQARFHCLLPVCAYDDGEQKRLRRRLEIFYENLFPTSSASSPSVDENDDDAVTKKNQNHDKIGLILKMAETEEQIFDTLCAKYCAGKVRIEQAQALRAGVFPLEDEQDQIKKNAGTLMMKDYPLLEREFRLRRRFELFHKKFARLFPVGANDKNEEETRLDEFIQMFCEKREEDVFAELCRKNKIDATEERKLAGMNYALPKF